MAIAMKEAESTSTSLITFVTCMGTICFGMWIYSRILAKRGNEKISFYKAPHRKKGTKNDATERYALKRHTHTSLSSKCVVFAARSDGFKRSRRF